jgi:predicted DNA-binding transcriptional regulator YafY
VSKRSAAETVCRIFWAFIEARSWSQIDLAKEVGVSPRAVRRRLQELERSGMKLHRDEDPPQVYWSVPRGWLPDGVALTRPDVAQVMRFIARSPRTATRDALMRRLMRVDADVVIEPNTAPLAEPESILTILEDARATKRTVRMLYTTAKTGVDSRRDVSVQHVEYAPRTRFVAFCHKARELRWFRVSRVRDAHLEDDVPFIPVPETDVASLLARSVDGWTDDTAPRAMSFVVYGDDARWVPGNLPSPEMTVETLDGGIRVKAFTSGLTVLARFVVGLGAAAVAETPELAERVEELARGAMARTARRAGPTGTGVVKAWNWGGRQAGKTRGVL